jgi:hypothetical protein
MPVQQQVGVPPIIEQGNAYIFTESFGSYPATTWTLELVLNSPALAVPPTFQAVVVNKTFQFTLKNADTSALVPPGAYDWAEYATEIASGERATAATGILQVIEDLTKPHVPTYAETMLSNIETAIAALSTGTNQSVNFAGQSFTKKDLAKMHDLFTYWQAAVYRERRAQAVYRGNQLGGMISTRFNVPAGTQSPFPSKPFLYSQ